MNEIRKTRPDVVVDERESYVHSPVWGQPAVVSKEQQVTKNKIEPAVDGLTGNPLTFRSTTRQYSRSSNSPFGTPDAAFPVFKSPTVIATPEGKVVAAASDRGQFAGVPIVTKKSTEQPMKQVVPLYNPVVPVYSVGASASTTFH